MNPNSNSKAMVIWNTEYFDASFKDLMVRTAAKYPDMRYLLSHRAYMATMDTFKKIERIIREAGYFTGPGSLVRYGLGWMVAVLVVKDDEIEATNSIGKRT